MESLYPASRMFDLAQEFRKLPEVLTPIKVQILSHARLGRYECVCDAKELTNSQRSHVISSCEREGYLVKLDVSKEQFVISWNQQ